MEAVGQVDRVDFGEQFFEFVQPLLLDELFHLRYEEVDRVDLGEKIVRFLMYRRHRRIL